MRIVWNSIERSFDCEFAGGDQWKVDQEAAKAAGFKTEGAAGGWVWYTQKITVLLKLKTLVQDISITPEALEQFKELKRLADVNAEILKKFETEKALARGELTPDQKAANKADREVKRAEKEQKRIAAGKPPKEKHAPRARGGDIKSYTPDLSRLHELVGLHKYIPPTPPDLKCIYCQDPVYFYEFTDVPRCLWCSKINEKSIDNVNTNLLVSLERGERETANVPGFE